MAINTAKDAETLEKLLRGTPLESAGCLKCDLDVFNGVTIRPNHLSEVNVDSFSQLLPVSLETWKQEGWRGVWIKIPIHQSELIPIATKFGFDFHHAQSGYVMLTKWLPTTEPNKLPTYANHYVGVAGFVINDKNELLVVQEKYHISLKRATWKFPGGLTNQGENLIETAIREVKEETGIDTVFVSLLCFRHLHQYRWGTSDLYFVCLLKPLHTDIIIDTGEIASCKWMDLNEYIADPYTNNQNKLIAETYVASRKCGYSLSPTVYPHFFPNKPDLVNYGIAPLVWPSNEENNKDNSGTVQPRL